MFVFSRPCHRFGLGQSPVSTARGLAATQREACMRSLTTQKPKRLPRVVCVRMLVCMYDLRVVIDYIYKYGLFIKWKIIYNEYSGLVLNEIGAIIYTNVERDRSLMNVPSNICRRCSNCIFILYLTPGFNRLGKDKCKTRRESFEFYELVHIILEILRYTSCGGEQLQNPCCNSPRRRCSVTSPMQIHLI